MGKRLEVGAVLHGGARRGRVGRKGLPGVGWNGETDAKGVLVVKAGDLSPTYNNQVAVC